MWIFLSLTLTIFLLLTLLVLQWIRAKYSYFKNLHVPHLPPVFPHGNLQMVGGQSNLMTFSKELYFHFRDHFPFGGIFVGFEPIVVLTDLNLIKSVLVSNFSAFPDHAFYLNDRDDPLSSTLFSLRGERWRHMRTKLSPTFSTGNVRNMFDTVQVIAWDMIHFLEANAVQKNEPFNAKTLAMRFICDSIGSCGFGLDCGALSQSDPILLEIAENLFPCSRFQLGYWLLTSIYEDWAKFFRLRVFPSRVTSYFSGIIRETVQYREENKVIRNDFMNLLIQIKEKGCLTEDEGGEMLGSISTDELQAQAFVIFFAGFHTSRVTLSFALFELAVNGTVQERLREEIFSKFDAEGQLSYESLEEMVYLEQVVNETLRKYPPQPYLSRVAAKETRLPGTNYTMQKNHQLYIPISGIHYDPEIYPDPDRFDPDRMTQEKMKKRHFSSFLPMGGGPRICLGYKFGLLQVKLGIAMILSKFRLTINSRTKQPLSFRPNRIDVDVEDGIWLNVSPLQE